MAKQNTAQTAAAPAAQPVAAQPVQVKKAMSPELQKKLADRKAKRVAARERVRTFIKENADQLGNLVADLQLFVGSGERAARVGGVRTSINSELRTALLAAADKGMTEMDIFKMFKIGRPEMVTKGRILVLCPNPADRVWVRFNEETETYHVVGTGATPPKDWTGYVPSAKESL